jgi:hypothetical protein
VPRPPRRDHDPENVSFSRKPAVEKGEPGRHEHEEAGGVKHEAGITCIEHMIGMLVPDVYEVLKYYSKYHFSLVAHDCLQSCHHNIRATGGASLAGQTIGKLI